MIMIKQNVKDDTSARFTGNHLKQVIRQSRYSDL